MPPHSSKVFAPALALSQPSLGSSPLGASSSYLSRPDPTPGSTVVFHTFERPPDAHQSLYQFIDINFEPVQQLLTSPPSSSCHVRLPSYSDLILTQDTYGWLSKRSYAKARSLMMSRLVQMLKEDVLPRPHPFCPYLLALAPARGGRDGPRGGAETSGND